MSEETKSKDTKKETAVSFIKELFQSLINLTNNYSLFIAYVSYFNNKYDVNKEDTEIEQQDKSKLMDLIYETRVILTKLHLVFSSMKRKFSLSDEEDKEINSLYISIRESTEIVSDDIEKYITLINSAIFNSVIGSILEDKQDLFTDTQNE